MREYTVIKTSVKDVESGRAWAVAPAAMIDVAPWGCEPYRPVAFGQFVCTEDAYYVRLTATEKKENIRAVATGIHPEVWLDSAMEMFFKPLPDEDARYMNFEFNTQGALYVGIGTGREDGRLLKETDINIFRIKNDMEDTGEAGMIRWSVTCRIPFSFLEQHFGKHDFANFKTMQGNFYKCGDATPQPHCICWNFIDWEKPDFHRPEFFGLFKAE